MNRCGSNRFGGWRSGNSKNDSIRTRQRCKQATFWDFTGVASFKRMTCITKPWVWALLNMNQLGFVEYPVSEPCSNIPALLSIVYLWNSLVFVVNCLKEISPAPNWTGNWRTSQGLHSWCLSGSRFLILLDLTSSPKSVLFWPCASIHLSHCLFDLFLGQIPALFWSTPFFCWSIPSIPMFLVKLP